MPLVIFGGVDVVAFKVDRSEDCLHVARSIGVTLFSALRLAVRDRIGQRLQQVFQQGAAIL